MGTIFTPTYANTSRRFFELTFYNFYRNAFDEGLENFIIVNWSCFLDDCKTLLD